MTVGVLALQGCIDPHIAMFARIGASCFPVKNVSDLEKVQRIVLPGGESTTMLKLLNSTGLYSALSEFGKRNPVWGICAGAILIAKEVIHPSQQSLGLIPIRATRNFYGSQLDSFKYNLQIAELDTSIDVDFIRAPLLEPISSEVKVLAKHENQPVLMQYKNILASSFHSELGDNPRLHQYFLSL